jgi:hypothetical protein
MTFAALLIAAYAALSRVQRVMWGIHRLVLAAVTAGLVWLLSRGWSP